MVYRYFVHCLIRANRSADAMSFILRVDDGPINSIDPVLSLIKREYYGKYYVYLESGQIEVTNVSFLHATEE